MTIDELYKELGKLRAAGHGDLEIHGSIDSFEADASFSPILRMWPSDAQVAPEEYPSYSVDKAEASEHGWPFEPTNVVISVYQ